MRLPAVFLVALVCLAGETWTPEVSLRVQSIADVVPSPDGKLVVWTQTRSLVDTEKSELLTHVWLANSDGSARRQLTRGDKSVTSPAFSPDGKFVFFTSDRAGKKNLYRIPIDGGEAEMLTNWKGVMGSFRISPDGNYAAFTGSDENPDEEKRKKEKRDFRVVDEDPKFANLWLVELKGEPPYRPKKLVPEKYHVGAIAWSPDSKAIAYEHRPTPNADDGRLADIAEVDLATARTIEIANGKYSEAEPAYSPDGRHLAFVRANGELKGSDIVLYSRESKTERALAKSFDENPRLAGWTADSRNVLFTESRGTHGGLFAMPVDGPFRELLVPERGALGTGLQLNATNMAVGLTLASSEEPAEAYVLRLGQGKPVRVSAANTDLPHDGLGKTELVHWKGKDGLDVEGLLTYPVVYTAGRKAPLILLIHGGPAGNFTESFIGSGAYPIATFASRGYAVLRPNIRGSVGYGQKFRASNLSDWGGGDYQDLMAGVDALISRGIVDPDRMAVMGWSYGGYMTSWVITQTNRFKCAAIGAGLTDLVSMWGTNDIPSVLDDYFGGTPWEAAQTYAKSSPLNFAKNVKTPTLILHGEIDPRVPVSQGYEMYHSLKRLGVETKMVVYPRTEHSPREPKFLLDIMERHLAWVDAHIGAPKENR